MPISLGFGFGSSKSSTTQSIDPYLRGLQESNYLGARSSIPQSYTPTSADQINSYLSPYTDDVVNASMGDLNRQRLMAVNGIGDAATAAHAFGGSRHGVAEGITNSEFARQGGLLSSQLRQQGYSQALGAAQQENQFGFQYPLLLQQILNQSLQGITPTITQNSRGSQMGANLGFSFGGSGGKG